MLCCLLQHIPVSTSNGLLEVSCFMWMTYVVRTGKYYLFVYIVNGVEDFLTVRLIIFYLFIFRMGLDCTEK